MDLMMIVCMGWKLTAYVSKSFTPNTASGFRATPLIVFCVIRGGITRRNENQAMERKARKARPNFENRLEEERTRGFNGRKYSPTLSWESRETSFHAPGS